MKLKFVKTGYNDRIAYVEPSRVEVHVYRNMARGWTYVLRDLLNPERGVEPVYGGHPQITRSKRMAESRVDYFLKRVERRQKALERLNRMLKNS